MDLNLTALAGSLGVSINWLSTIIGGIIGAIFSICVWFYERENAKKATLYYPLFLACRDIIEIIKNPESMGEERSRSLYASCAKTLDEIVYTHGSIINLKKGEDLNAFLSMKRTIDGNLEFIEKKHWTALKDKFNSKEFKEVERYAKVLISRCKEEVKDFKKITE